MNAPDQGDVRARKRADGRLSRPDVGSAKLKRRLSIDLEAILSGAGRVGWARKDFSKIYPASLAKYG